MKYTLFPFALLFLFFLPSCHKEKITGLTLDRYRNILDSTKLVCNGITSQYYLSAKINGSPVCYSDGADGYTLSTKPYSTFTTSGTSTNIGETGNDPRSFFQLEAFHQIENYVDNFFISSPKWNGNHEIQDILDRYLLIGSHSIASINTSDTIGFNVGFSICYDYREKQPGIGLYYSQSISSQNGTQDRSSYLEFTKVEKDTTSGYIKYNIEAKFQCQLYHAKSSPEEGKLYGDLTDGKLVMQIVLDN